MVELKTTNPNYITNMNRIMKDNYLLPVINNKIYYMIVAVNILSLIGLLFNNRLSVKDVGLGYLLSQITFLSGHAVVHACFIEYDITNKDIDNTGVGNYVAYLHHYENSKELPYFWMQHRLSYIFDTPLVYLTWLPFINSKLLGLFFSYSGWWLLQGPLHEWYHLNNSERKHHFNPIINNLFHLSEKIGMVSTKHHQLHHKHQKNNLEDVEKFSDMYIPFLEEIEQKIWNFNVNIKNKYKWKKTLYYLSSIQHFIVLLASFAITKKYCY